MPEGHTIHGLARDLRATLGDAPIRATSPQGRFAAGAALLDGERLVRSDAYGKYLFVEVTGGHILHVHLGLIGKFRSVPPTTPDRDSIRLRLANDTTCWDLTGPTRCDLVDPSERAAVARTLGPDPLRRGARPDRMIERCARAAAPIGAVLLDQRVVAGIGNVYRAEILFLLGIDPRRSARHLDADEVAAIWDETVRLMRIGLRLGRIVTTDPAEIGRPRSRMRADDRLYVYHREHCRRCGTALLTSQIGGRPMQHCPTCQT